MGMRPSCCSCTSELVCGRKLTRHAGGGGEAKVRRQPLRGISRLCQRCSLQTLVQASNSACLYQENYGEEQNLQQHCTSLSISMPKTAVISSSPMRSP